MPKWIFQKISGDQQGDSKLVDKKPGTIDFYSDGTGCLIETFEKISNQDV